MERGLHLHPMRLQRTCLPYLVIVAVVMSIYSIFLVHLTKSFRPSSWDQVNADGTTGSDPWTQRLTETPPPPSALPCVCSPESAAGLEARREVVIGLSYPYHYFNSNHWFHISEYYVSRHMRVAPNLPQNATVYVVAPHELFVSNLIPMTFFLLLLAFTDGTARTVEVLPKRAMVQLEEPRHGDVLVLDNTGFESYVYDSSLPPFKRTRRYKEGERPQPQHPRELASLEAGAEKRQGEGEREEKGFEASDGVNTVATEGGSVSFSTRNAEPKSAADPPDEGAAHGSPDTTTTAAAVATTTTTTTTTIATAQDRGQRLAAGGDASAATVATAGTAATAASASATAAISSNRYLRSPNRDGERDGGKQHAASPAEQIQGLWSDEAGGGDEEGERGARGGFPAELVVAAGTTTPPPLVERGSVSDGGAGAFREATDERVGAAPEGLNLALGSGEHSSEDHLEGATASIGGRRYTGRGAEKEAFDVSVATPVAVVARVAPKTVTSDQERGLAVQGDEEKGAGPEPAITAAGVTTATGAGAVARSPTAAAAAAAAGAGERAGERAGARSGTEAGIATTETETATVTATAAAAAAAMLDAGAGARGVEWRGYANEVDLAAEFFPLSSGASAPRRSCACARYIGEFGAAPVERGYWFKEEKVESTRARIDALCGDIYRHGWHGGSAGAGAEGEGGGSPGKSGGGESGDSSRRRKLVIYQRDNDRRLLGLDDNVAVFRELLGANWLVVPIVHDNAHEPCWLYSQLMDADMLLTPHGFQSMLLLFLPPGATILEVFPYKYWKEGYAPLAEEWGVRHELIMSRPVSWAKRLALFFVPLERCMRSIDCRKWSRGADVRLEDHHLRQIAEAAKEASRKRKMFLQPPSPSASSAASKNNGRR